MIIYLTRGQEHPDGDGTPGVLRSEDTLFQCDTLELPRKGNRPNLSCIPPAEYHCQITRSPHLSAKAGRDVYTYEIMNVPGRSGERIHSGNFAGDVTRGRQADVLGCILPGEANRLPNRKGDLQHGVFFSKTAIKRLLAYTAEQPFTLRIIDPYWTAPRG